MDDFAQALPSSPDGVEYVADRPDPVECDCNGCWHCEGGCEDGCEAEVEPAKHPFHDAWMPPTPPCDDCYDARQRQQDAIDRFRQKWKEDAGVPERLRRFCARRNIALADPLDALVDPDTAPQFSCVYLHGPVGTGKSTQLVASVGEYLARRLKTGGYGDARYVDCTEFFDRMRASWDEEGADLTTRPLRRTDYLALDDFARSEPSPWKVERLYSVINHRYSEGKSTAVASNHSLLELHGGAGLDVDPSAALETAGTADHDDRVIDRLWEMAGGWRDRRPTAVVELDEQYRSPRR